MKVRNGRFGRTGRIFGTPLLLAALTVFGLLAALLGEGWWHALAWVALSVPLVSIAWNVVLRGVRSRRANVRPISPAPATRSPADSRTATSSADA